MDKNATIQNNISDKKTVINSKVSSITRPVDSGFFVRNKDALRNSLMEKTNQLKGISPRVSTWAILQKEIEEIKQKLGI